jgi:hypothetical protein
VRFSTVPLLNWVVVVVALAVTGTIVVTLRCDYFAEWE